MSEQRIIRTRYRDVPFEEVLKCASKYHPRFPDERLWWESHRARSVEIVTPAFRSGKWPRSKYACEGPFYAVAESAYAVCPHIAEIGD
jgi:hypothetical protein